MDEFYNNHYIRTDAGKNIIIGWSNGPLPGKDTADAICINEQGGYQFRLFPDGEENPRLQDDNGVCLYRYIDGAVVPKTPEEVAAETPEPEPPAPTQEERNRADIDYLLIMGGLA